MARKKGAVRKGQGVMCNICGLNCGKGGALKKHVEGRHFPVTYDAYSVCFASKAVLIDAWDDSRKTASGKKVIIHSLVTRFEQSPTAKSVTRSARKRGP